MMKNFFLRNMQITKAAMLFAIGLSYFSSSYYVTSAQTSVTSTDFDNVQRSKKLLIEEKGVTKQPELYVVNFTADWCPNCKVLDPALYKALENVDKSRVKHIAFDMTTPAKTNQTFDLVNGTVLAGVYGDYLGITGVVVMIAGDSGEKIDCATRLVSSEVIEASIENSLDIVRNRPAGTRTTDSYFCPPSNRKIPA